MAGRPKHADDTNAAGDSPIIHQAKHDWEGSKSLIETIDRMLSAVDRDHEPTAGVPLYSVVETDALERLFSPIDEVYPRERGAITVPFRGYWLSVFADGTTILGTRPVGPGDLPAGK